MEFSLKNTEYIIFYSRSHALFVFEIHYNANTQKKHYQTDVLFHYKKETT